MSISLKTSLKLLILVGLFLSFASFQLTQTKNALSILLGYVSFSSNMLIVTWLAQLATIGITGHGYSKKRSALMPLLGGLKFLALIAILFISIVRYEMPPLYIAGGALVGLITFVWLFAVRYLKDMASQS